ncbi:MAG: helix-turn-helix domain-containing protein [Patescibacteria group bacterium]|nr:helix-turn-helix domain-containing protein [Patescibacteria group bacterium]
MKRTLKELKNTIVTLHEKGYSSAKIGKQLKKDHTTILYHLKNMGFKTDYGTWRKKNSGITYDSLGRPIGQDYQTLLKNAGY